MQDQQAESAPRKVGRWLKGLGGATLMVGVGAALVYGGVRGARQAEAESKGWAAWSSAHCSLRGNRLIPGGVLTSDQELSVYECRDGTTYESKPGRVPKTWVEAHPTEAGKAGR